MRYSKEQRVVFAFSGILLLIVVTCWVFLLVGGPSFAQQIADGNGGFARLRSLAVRLLPGVPADAFVPELLAELRKFALRLTIIYAACQTLLLVGSMRCPHLFRDFFAAETHPLNLSLFRIVYFLTLFPRVRLNSLVNLSQTPKELWVAPPGLGWFVDLAPQDPAVITCIYVIFAAACVAGALGMATRVACIAATLTTFYLLGVPQCFGKINHYHHIIWIGALLSCARCADTFSIDALWRALRGRISDTPAPSRIYAVPLRFVLLFLGVLYFFPGCWKFVVSGTEWFLSDNLRSRILLRTFVSPGWEPLIHVEQYPWLCRLSGLGTILWEIGFLFLVFSRWGRYIAAAAGLTFHFMVKQLLNISFWPIQVYYLAFADLHAWLKRVGQSIFPRGLTMEFTRSHPVSERVVAAVQALDLLTVVSYKPVDHVEDGDGFGVRVGADSGWPALRHLARIVPLFWICLPILARMSGRSGLLNRSESRTSRLRGVSLVGVVVLGASFVCGFTMFDSWPFGVYPTFARIIPPVFQSLTMEVVGEAGEPLANVELFYDSTMRAVYPPLRLGEVLQHVARAPDRTARLQEIWTLWHERHPEILRPAEARFFIANYSCEPEDADKNPVSRRPLETLRTP